jgi:simple sugar transport system ATP-binding protein
VRRVKASGVGILYISHHLEEIYEICDTVTVLRDGRRITAAPVAELEHDRLVAAMVGGELARAQDAVAVAGDAAGPTRLELSHVSVPAGSTPARSTARSREASRTCRRTGMRAGSCRRSACART